MTAAIPTTPAPSSATPKRIILPHEWCGWMPWNCPCERYQREQERRERNRRQQTRRAA